MRAFPGWATRSGGLARHLLPDSLGLTKRPGPRNVNDSTQAAGFLRIVIGELRLSGGFLYPEVLRFLVEEALCFAVAPATQARSERSLQRIQLFAA